MVNAPFWLPGSSCWNLSSDARMHTRTHTPHLVYDKALTAKTAPAQCLIQTNWHTGTPQMCTHRHRQERTEQQSGCLSVFTLSDRKTKHCCMTWCLSANSWTVTVIVPETQPLPHTAHPMDAVRLAALYCRWVDCSPETTRRLQYPTVSCAPRHTYTHTHTHRAPTANLHRLLLSLLRAL